MNDNNESRKRDDRSIGTLVSELTQEITTLFRQEVGLAKLEMSEKLSQAQSGAITLVIGGAVAYAGLLFLLLAAVMGLALFMEGWIAALIVSVAVIIIGMSMVSSGKSKLKGNNLMPRKAIRQMQKDGEVVRNHAPGEPHSRQHPV